jgi:hypothetical protein
VQVKWLLAFLFGIPKTPEIELYHGGHDNHVSVTVVGKNSGDYLQALSSREDQSLDR